MASLLGNLRVRLTAETEDFRRGLDSARTKVSSFEKDLSKFRNSTLANVASFGALAMVIKSSLSVANEYDNAQRQLAATAKLTGVNLGYLESVLAKAQDQFKLSAVSANAFTIEMTKLAGKAGDVGKASAGLEAFLDIGAARGMSADETLKAVSQSILGIDEGTDKLFSKNPSVLYAEFAAKIGTTAGKLTDQQKAQALLDAAMQDGSKVRGEYQKWLGTSQGQQYLLSQGIEKTQAALGKALQPALVAVIPIISKLADYVYQSIQGWQMLGATIGMIPGLFQAAKQALHGDLSGARKQVEATTEAWREAIATIQNPPKPTGGTGALDIKKNIPKPTEIKKAAKETAVTFYSDLKEEWENLKHSVTLEGLQIGGTDSQKLGEDERHALALLDIEKEHVLERFKIKDITAAERDQLLKQLATRRQLAQATRSQMETAQRANATITAEMARQSILTDDAIARAQAVNQTAIARLGNEGHIEERLKLQLDLADTTYQLRLQALGKESSLTEQQLANERLKLDLAHEREKSQLRMNAAVEKELSTKKKGDLKATASGAAAGLVSAGLSGSLSGSQIGSTLAGLGAKAIGGAVAGPIGMAVASGLGGLVGGLFDHKKKEDARVINRLEAIAFNTAETITAIQDSTEKLMNPSQMLFNLPSNFTIPNYNPNAGGGGTSYTVRNTYRVDVGLTVNGNPDPYEIKRAVEKTMDDKLAGIISTGRTNTPRRIAHY
jgi:hypothetical protein